MLREILKSANPATTHGASWDIMAALAPIDETQPAGTGDHAPSVGCGQNVPPVAHNAAATCIPPSDETSFASVTANNGTFANQRSAASQPAKPLRQMPVSWEEPDWVVVPPEERVILPLPYPTEQNNPAPQVWDSDGIAGDNDEKTVCVPRDQQEAQPGILRRLFGKRGQ